MQVAQSNSIYFSNFIATAIVFVLLLALVCTLGSTGGSTMAVVGCVLLWLVFMSSGSFVASNVASSICTGFGVSGVGEGKLHLDHTQPHFGNLESTVLLSLSPIPLLLSAAILMSIAAIPGLTVNYRGLIVSTAALVAVACTSMTASIAVANTRNE